MPQSYVPAPLARTLRGLSNSHLSLDLTLGRIAKMLGNDSRGMELLERSTWARSVHVNSFSEHTSSRNTCRSHMRIQEDPSFQE